MPRATVSLDPEDKVELKTCPGAYVILRRLSYGQKLQRSQQAAKMGMDLSKKKSAHVSMDMLNREAAYFDFKLCVMDHNLEDENGGKLDLSSPGDVDRLDPKIGEEISSLIDKMNNFEEDLDDDQGNS